MAENSDDQITPIEIVEELTEDELADRHRLEMRVERSFVDAGVSLRELRDRRLYRSTHRTFDDYVGDRFGYKRAYCYQLIEAAGVVENLSANCIQILPTRESQCRELTKVEPEQQPEAWQKAIARTPGKKVPAASTVKEVVKEATNVKRDSWTKSEQGFRSPWRFRLSTEPTSTAQDQE